MRVKRKFVSSVKDNSNQKMFKIKTKSPILDKISSPAEKRLSDLKAILKISMARLNSFNPKFKTKLLSSLDVDRNTDFDEIFVYKQITSFQKNIFESIKNGADIEKQITNLRLFTIFRFALLHILLSAGAQSLIKLLKEEANERKEMEKLKPLAKSKPQDSSADYLDLIIYTLAKDLIEMSNV